MIDIIIPAYNSKKTIKTTLNSIKKQTNKNFEVTIVNDAGQENYEEEIKYYSKYFKIKEMKLKNNGGPGIARQYGIDNTKNEYIIFIDSDDYLYDENSIDKLEKSIKNNDVIISNFIYERDNEITIKKKNNVWLHGKIYSRQFLENNKIRFNNTRANEDNGFNRLIILHEPKTQFLDEVTYVYHENPDSITRKENRLYKFTGLEMYSYNIEWAIKEALKKKINYKGCVLSALGALVSNYYYYLELYDEYDVSKILEWNKGLKKIYQEYKDKYIDETIINLVLKEKEEEYKNKKINKRITFDQFIELI